MQLMFDMVRRSLGIPKTHEWAWKEHRDGYVWTCHACGKFVIRAEVGKPNWTDLHRASIDTDCDVAMIQEIMES